ncbi:hypothetical protein COLO4_35634 [Corchorus olitorius]|uniref:Uncharacterized protein n=1 Tax=Corchorus olitorius TaxID=93759 RepID=A0A1R3GEG3_9ROSI|nr:hypothetical protein COLO4_35634 [Corchorus olitorius]
MENPNIDDEVESQHSSSGIDVGDGEEFARAAVAPT